MGTRPEIEPARGFVDSGDDINGGNRPTPRAANFIKQAEGDIPRPATKGPNEVEGAYPKPSVLEEKKQHLDHEVETLTTAAIERQRIEDLEHEANMIELKRQKIEMAMKFQATEEGRKAVKEKIEQEYIERKKKRDEEAKALARIEMGPEGEGSINRAAEIARLQTVGRDVNEVKGLASNMYAINEARKRKEREDVKEKHEAMKAAADLKILSEKLDTQIRSAVERPTEIPSTRDCWKFSNFDDTRFLSICSLLWCPYPGLCIVQNYLMKKLHLEKEDPNHPTWNLWWDKLGFAGLPLATCCLGLAWNRERIIDQTISRNGNFFFDCLAFTFCMGCIPMMRDELYLFPVKKKLNKKFKEKMFVLFDKQKVRKAMNCIACFSAVFSPFPSVCLLQACTIVEIEVVLRSVTPIPLIDKNEKRTLLIQHFLIGSLGCCIGLALNRSKIADGIGVDEHCGLDCLRYMVLFPCLAVQECYSINEMRNPSVDER